MKNIFSYPEIYQEAKGWKMGLIGHGPTKSTKITSDMHRGYVVSDGWEETHFTRGSTVTINLNGPSLQLLTLEVQYTTGSAVALIKIIN